MTAEEIRTGYSERCVNWKGFPLYTGSHGAVPAVLIEIAAQLAEMNEHLSKLVDPAKGISTTLCASNDKIPVMICE